MSIPAVFWLSADGPVWRDDIAVPEPPPHRYAIAVCPPLGFACIAESHTPPTRLDIHDLEFKLVKYNRHGAHYELDTRPPAGYRWTFHGQRVWAEKLPDKPPDEVTPSSGMATLTVNGQPVGVVSVRVTMQCVFCGETWEGMIECPNGCINPETDRPLIRRIR